MAQLPLPLFDCRLSHARLSLLHFQVPKSSLAHARHLRRYPYTGMSGVLEIPAFVIGFAGLTAVYDKVCLTWKTFAQAANFGDDVADIFAEMEMEYLKFEMWWSTMGDLVRETNGPHHKPRTTAPKGSLLAILQENMASQCLSTAAQIQTGFEKIERILKKIGSLSTLDELAKNPSSSTSTEAPSTSVERAQQSHRRRARELLKNASFTRRVLHNAKPWGSADKDDLEKEVKRLRNCNDQLYTILPQRLRDVILERASLATCFTTPKPPAPFRPWARRPLLPRRPTSCCFDGKRPRQPGTIGPRSTW